MSAPRGTRHVSAAFNSPLIQLPTAFPEIVRRTARLSTRNECLARDTPPHCVNRPSVQKAGQRRRANRQKSEFNSSISWSHPFMPFVPRVERAPSIPLYHCRGSGQAALHCAHRTTHVLLMILPSLLVF